ncbi:MAG: hypothetical protein QME81_04320 [bacterium]|nr:hypothetical protein [bacterium]
MKMVSSPFCIIITLINPYPHLLGIKTICPLRVKGITYYRSLSDKLALSPSPLGGEGEREMELSVKKVGVKEISHVPKGQINHSSNLSESLLYKKRR